MNQRSKDILLLLVEKQGLSLQELAVLHEVSERTIRNDISSLNDYLANLSLGTIAIKNKQLTLNLKISKKDLLAAINRFNIYDYKFSSDERCLICLLILIRSHDYVTIKELSDRLLTSRSTIVNDLKNMRRLAAEHGISLLSKANKGYCVEADEATIRQFIYQVMVSDLFPLVETIIFEDNYKETMKLVELEELFNDSRRLFQLSEKEMTKLFNYLLISAYRHAIGFAMTEGSCFIPETYKTLVASETWLAYPYLDEGDWAFVCARVKEEFLTSPLDSKLNKELIRIQVIVMTFIEKISQDLRIDFKDDYTFYENFSAHILRMMREEPLPEKTLLFMNDVIGSNFRIRNVILENLHIIEENINRHATAVEINYIIIHVYAAMERKKRKGNNLKVALLTDEKATEILFIEGKLVSNFSFNLDIYSVEDRLRGNYDLILTTVQIPNRGYIQISPFVSDEDYIRIAREIDRLVKEREFYNFSLSRDVALRLYDLLSDEIDQEEDRDQLKRNIKNSLLSLINPDESRNQGDARRLADFLQPDRITLDVEADTWQEAIYKTGKNMISRGEIDKNYLDEVVDNIRDNGPYMVISSGFAFPHAEISAYNRQTAMQLVRLKRPVYFDDYHRDLADDIATQPVRYICLLSAVDRQAHLKAFFNLSNLLKDEAFKESLGHCQTAEELHRVIAEAEELLELGR